MGIQFGKNKAQTLTKSSSTPTYEDPRGQSALDRLSQSAGGTSPDASALSDFYRGQMSGGGGNPQLENIIASEGALGQRQLQDNLSLIRSGGYRGGAGRGAIDQGMFMSDFSARQAADNARLRAADYDTGVGRQFAGAGGLSGTEDRSLGSAQTLINALRGNRGTGTGNQSGSQVGGELDIAKLLSAL